MQDLANDSALLRDEDIVMSGQGHHSRVRHLALGTSDARGVPWIEDLREVPLRADSLIIVSCSSQPRVIRVNRLYGSDDERRCSTRR